MFFLNFGHFIRIIDDSKLVEKYSEHKTQQIISTLTTKMAVSRVHTSIQAQQSQFALTHALTHAT